MGRDGTLGQKFFVLVFQDNQSDTRGAPENCMYVCMKGIPQQNTVSRKQSVSPPSECVLAYSIIQENEAKAAYKFLKTHE